METFSMKKLRNDIALKSKTFSIDFEEKIAEVSFEDEETAEKVIDVYKRFDFPRAGYDIVSVEKIDGDDFSRMFARYHGGNVIYEITFEQK